MPLDDLLTQIGADTSDIIPASLDWVKYQGKLYGLPFLQDDWGFYWNTDAFKEVGLDPAMPPKTPDELWTMAKKLTKYNADGSLARAGFIPDYPGKNLTELSQLFGCKYYDDATKKVTVNSPELRRLVRLVQEVLRQVQQERRADQADRQQGLRGRGPVLHRQGRDGPLRRVGPGCGLCPELRPDPQLRDGTVPGDQPGRVRRRVRQRQCLLHPDGVKNPDAAAQFGMYLMTDDPSRAMAIQNASVPQLKSLVTDPTLTGVKHFGTFLDIANHPKTWTNPMISQWSALHDGMDTALDSVLTGGVASQKALDDLAKTIQADIDANGP